jgi:hypothetical protein
MKWRHKRIVLPSCYNELKVTQCTAGCTAVPSLTVRLLPYLLLLSQMMYGHHFHLAIPSTPCSLRPTDGPVRHTTLLTDQSVTRRY